MDQETADNHSMESDGGSRDGTIHQRRQACHHHVVNRNVSQHVAVVIVRHLTPILFVLFLQHGSRGRQLFGEGADPA